MEIIATNQDKAIYVLNTLGNVVKLENNRKDKKLTINDSEGFAISYEYKQGGLTQEIFNEFIIAYIKKQAENQGYTIIGSEQDIINSLQKFFTEENIL